MELSWRKAAGEDPPGRPALSAMDTPLERSLLTRSRAAAVILAALAVAAGAFGYIRYGIARSLTVRGDRVVLSTVRTGEFREYIPLTGVVEPRETVYLDAVDGGQVAQIMTEEGSLVKAGQPLIRLSNADLELQVINSEAQLSEQLDRLTNTKLQYQQARLSHSRDLIDAKYHTKASAARLERLMRLKDDGLVARSSIEDERIELDRLAGLEAEIAHAKEVDESLQKEEIGVLDRAVAELNRNLDLTRKNLNNLVIVAPSDGRLTTLNVHLGESKQRGQRIGQVDRLDSFKITAMVDEHYLSRVSVGRAVTTEIDGTAFQLTVIKVYPEVRERQFKVDLQVPDRMAGSLRPGQSLQLRLQLGGPSRSLIVDNGAFFDDSGGQWAFVLRPGDHVAMRRPVKLGRRNLEQVEVLQGLAPGERVIVSGYESFRDIERISLTGNL